MQNRTLQIIVIISLYVGLGYAAVAQIAVPIEKEPRHRLKFGNQYVRLFDVLIPKGDTSLYHIHRYDGVSVRLSNAQILDEVLGGQKVEFILKPGEVTFGLRPAEMTHRVINNGSSDFRNIFIEILPVAVRLSTIKSSEPLPDHKLLFDNDRVSAYRVVLKPGRSTQVHNRDIKGISVFVTDAKIQIIVSERKTKTKQFRSGEFMWYDAGKAQAVKNVGPSDMEMVVFGLK